ncbi:uncharacterized protein FIBRA_01679 [Fibroporia radiculosa]|uniref:Vacuolar sorting protein Vps3844 C-terminal domain-containing protein n=1 Tax=Fibroporia radiculosa TaxID=599839 RepID=J4H1C5_9APHY|nr:uncharacterized protein FIBRA_01679 [Fibroporia radiculosa]CCL99659.1 predicted protein [Fibroporia radiculosa]
MRTASICLLLAGVSEAVHVYLYPQPSVPPLLSISQAGAALACHLGLDYHEILGDDDTFFHQKAFVGQGPSSSLLLSMSEDAAEDAIPINIKESFSLTLASSPSALSSLIPAYLDRARHAYSQIFSEPVLPTTVPRIIDIFSVPSSASQIFLSEMTTLVDFLESNEFSTDKFAALELNGLSALAEEHGRDSEQYHLASETIRSFISSAVEKRDLKLAIVTIPDSVKQLKRQDGTQVQPPQSPLPPPIAGPAEPIDAVSTCFTSAEVCGNSTNSCSGHGQCVSATKAGRTCFVCACAATKDAQGRTEKWAGNSCERKDVSGPFVLLTGTVVALILLVGGSVALLSAIGDQELPSTLTGGVVSTSRKD